MKPTSARHPVPGPVQMAHRAVAGIAGDMSFAIQRQDAPTRRVAAWIRTLSDALDRLQTAFPEAAALARDPEFTSE